MATRGGTACSFAALLAAVGGPAASAADVKIVSAVNSSGAFVSDLTIAFAGTGGALFVVPETVVSPAGCSAPMVSIAVGVATVDWGAPCVPPGAAVKFVASTTAGPLAFASGSWTTATGATSPLAATSVSLADTVGAAASLTVPVTATVSPPTGGPAASAVIGTVTVTTGALGPGMCHALSTGLSSKIKAEFDFAPGYGWIDAVYDVKWINVLTAYIPMPGCPPVPVVPSTPGVPLSSFPCANFLAFPAIDPNPCGTLPAGCPPAPGGCVPGGTIGADDFPYYTGEAFWTSGTPAADVEHDECALTRFCDYPTVCVAVFRLFPVLDPLSGPLAPTEFCVLDGISWFVGEPSPTGGIPAGIIGTAPADPGLIGAALAGGLAPFPAWSALPSSGCPIASPTIGVGCNSLPGPAPTISPECPPEVGAPFTWKVAGLVPSTPIPLASPVGSPPITAISAAPLAAPVDLFGLGMGIPSGACFVYLPLSLLLVGAPVGPSGVSTSTMAIPLDPTLAGISFDLQSFQLVYISTVSLTAPAAFLATPYLAVTLVP